MCPFYNIELHLKFIQQYLGDAEYMGISMCVLCEKATFGL